MSGFRSALWRMSPFGGRRRPSAEMRELLALAGANLQRTAELVESVLAEWPDGPDLRSEISRCEQEGDRLTRRLIADLHRARMTPSDRQDVYALAEAIDDVVDDLEEVSEEIAIYRIEAPMESAQRLAGVARDSGRALRRALDGLSRLERVDSEVEEIRRLEHEGDRLYREALAGLFAASVDPMVVIRWKDIYAGLEDSIDRARHAANVLQRITVKHA
jgi:predicted phosphate transport protein (TIGR00153 family)